MLLAVAALAMTACSKSETEGVAPAAQTKAIGFESLVTKGSRALVNDNFTKFQVYGTYHALNQENNKVVVFNNIAVTKTAEGWGYTTPRYWIKDALYNFYAYSCDNDVIPAGKGNANFSQADGYALNIADYISDGSNQKDLVFARSAVDIVGKESGNTAVAFSFKHILAKLNVKFVHNYPADYKLEVSKVQIKQVRNIGKYNGKEGLWSNVNCTVAVADVPEIDLQFADGAVATLAQPDENAVTTWGYVIPFPYTSANVVISFDLKITNPLGETIFDNLIEGKWQPTWEQGYGYAYTVTLTGQETGLEPIEFTVNEWDANDGWTSGNGQSITFNPANPNAPAGN